MADDVPAYSWQRFKWAWKLAFAKRAEARADFGRALQLLDEAARIKPLWPAEQVQRAMLLLRNQRTREAHDAFAMLRNAFAGSADPELRYLRHYCTTMLSMLLATGQWSYEARQAREIECSPRLKRRFPMVTVDELDDRREMRRKRRRR